MTPGPGGQGQRFFFFFPKCVPDPPIFHFFQNAYPPIKILMDKIAAFVGGYLLKGLAGATLGGLRVFQGNLLKHMLSSLLVGRKEPPFMGVVSIQVASECDAYGAEAAPLSNG